MYIATLLTPRSGSVYDIGETLPSETDDTAEIWRPSWDAATIWDQISADVMSLDDSCGALLDIGDVDYLDSVQCERLLPWLRQRLASSIGIELRELYEAMRSACERAVELGTGVVIEL